MKRIRRCSLLLLALLVIVGCANTSQMSAEEREAIRRSNEVYERSRGP